MGIDKIKEICYNILNEASDEGVEKNIDSYYHGQAVLARRILEELET